MAVGTTILVLGCALVLSVAANPAPIRADLDLAALENELKEFFDDSEKEVKSLDTRSVVEIEDVTCGWFETVDGMSLFGYNTKTLYGVTTDECMEACAYEYNFYCRSADYNHDSDTCYLSSESDLTQPHDYSNNFNTVYFRRHCTDPTPEQSGSGWYY